MTMEEILNIIKKTSKYRIVAKTIIYILCHSIFIDVL